MALAKRNIRIFCTHRPLGQVVADPLYLRFLKMLMKNTIQGGVVSHHLVAAFEKPPCHVHTHFSQANYRNFHQTSPFLAIRRLFLSGERKISTPVGRFQKKSLVKSRRLPPVY